MLRRTALLTVLLLAGAAAPAPAAVTVDAPRAVEGQDLVFTVQSGLLDGPLRAETADGTATAPADYTATTKGPPLSSPQDTVRVPTVADGAPERDETVILRVRNAVTGAVVAEGVGTIVDDDPPPLSLSADVAIAESGGAAQLTVSSVPVDRPVSFTWSTAPGTATPGADYAAEGGRVTIPAGASSATIRVPILDDADDEEDETFSVVLGDPAGATIARGAATVTILNDDLRVLSIGDASVTEPEDGVAVARLPVTLSAPTFRTVTVRYATIDGTATAPADYLSRIDTLTLAPGQTTAEIEVAVRADTRREPVEVFGVILAEPQGAVLGRSAGAVSIADGVVREVGNGDLDPPNMRVDGFALKGRTLSLRVACPRNETRCRGRATVFTAANRRAPARLLREERRVGRAGFTLRGGQARRLRITVPLTVHQAARRTGRVRYEAFVLAQDDNDNWDTKETGRTFRVRR